MKITLTESFQRDIAKISLEKREHALEVLLKLPKGLKNIPHHSGLGLRKIHPSGIFEARVGLGLRMVFALKKDQLILHRIGNHEEIRRYLKTL